MDKLQDICLEEVGLEGLDGITLETLWLRLRMRDPPFPLRLDDKAKSILWKYLTKSVDVEFFELPETRPIPKLQEAQLSDGPERLAPTLTTVYPIAYIEDKEKGVRGSCTTYYQRKNVTDEIRDEEGNLKMSLAEVDERWESKLVVVANQDLRWKCMVGPHGDPEADLNIKQYVMLEAIVRGRSQGEWQCILAKHMKIEAKTVFYHRKNLTKAGFIKRRLAVYQHGDRPTIKTVKLFGHGFKENTTVPVYETVWKGMSDILSEKYNRTWSSSLLKPALKELFPSLKITDKVYKNIISGAISVKLVERLSLKHQEVFNETKYRKNEPKIEITVMAIRLLKTYDEYTNEDNLDEEEDEDEMFSQSNDPQESLMVAERSLKSQVLNIITEAAETKQYLPHRSIIQSLSIHYYSSRFILRRLLTDKIITQILTDEGRQRTAVYCPVNSIERVQKILCEQELDVTERSVGTDNAGPSAAEGSAGTSGSATTVKQEFGEIVSAKHDSGKFTLNHRRRIKFILDFMKKEGVVDTIFPILKAIRTDEKRLGLNITCDTKTGQRMVNKMVKEGQLQTLTTFVMSDDGLHTKTITLIMDGELKQSDPAVTSALQVARFRFFGSSSHKRKHPPPPRPKPVTVANVDSSGYVSQTNEPQKKKKKLDHKSPDHKVKKMTPKKHKEKDKNKEKDKKKAYVKEKQKDKTPKKHKDMDKDKDAESVKDKEGDENKVKNKDKDIPHTDISNENDVDKENMDNNQEKGQIPSAPQEKETPNEEVGRPYATRKFYYRQLGYQPKMARMRVCHLFLWYMAYGSHDKVIKTETIHDIESYKASDADDNCDNQGGAIPIKIVKADEEKEALVDSMDVANNNEDADVIENIPMDIAEDSSSSSQLTMSETQKDEHEVIQSETTFQRTDQLEVMDITSEESNQSSSGAEATTNMTSKKRSQLDMGINRMDQSEVSHDVTSDNNNISDNGDNRTNQSEVSLNVTSDNSSQSDNGSDRTNKSDGAHNVTSDNSSQSDRTNQSDGTQNMTSENTSQSDRTNQSDGTYNVSADNSSQSDNGSDRTNQSDGAHNVTSENMNQSDNISERTNQSDGLRNATSEKSNQSDNDIDRTTQSEVSHDVTSENTNQLDNAADRTNQSGFSKPSHESSNDTDRHLPMIDDDDISILDPPGTDTVTLLGNIEFKVYSDTYDWRRYVPPLPYDPRRMPGWVVARDMLMSIPISVFLNIVSLPIEIKGIKEYLDHPLKRHILMRHLPMYIRKQVLRGRKYLFSIQDLFIRLSSVGLIVLANMNKVEKDQMAVYVCKKASILDTTTSKPQHNLISDQQRYMRRFYELTTMKDAENYWFDLQCICLDTPLGVNKPKAKKGEPGEPLKGVKETRHDSYIRTITREVESETHPFADDGLPPGDGRGAGGLDSCFFSHLRRNWNWFNSFIEVNYDRYTAIKSKAAMEDRDMQTGKKSKLKRLGTIQYQYRRSNMSKGTPVEVVSVNKEQRKEMQATVARLKNKKPGDTSTPTKKQIIKEKNSETKKQSKEAKKNDGEINGRPSILRPKMLPSGRRNTCTYDDKDEIARSRMNKMRVDWTPEEDSLILLCRVASTILNTKAQRLGAFVPWFVVRDILHRNIERSRDKTTASVSKRSHHIIKNPSTYLNFKICVAEAEADPNIMEESKKTDDYTQVSVCAKEFEGFVEKLKEKFQSSNTTIGALKDINELNNYVITPVHEQGLLDQKVFLDRDVKTDKDIQFKLLQSLVMSSLASQRSKFFNNMLLYKTYDQYDQDLLGEVFLTLRKLSFCNRKRKMLPFVNAKRIIPVAPITIQLSQTYRDRFSSSFHGTLVEEICRFQNSLHSAGNSMVLPTEMHGGDLASLLGLLSLDKISIDVELPDKIIVVDSNLVELDLGPDSDSDDDDITSSKENRKLMSSRADIQELIKMQEKNRKADKQEVAKETSVETLSVETTKPNVVSATPKNARPDVDVSIPKKDTVSTHDEPMDTEHLHSSASVIIDHSYSTPERRKLIDTPSIDELALDSCTPTNTPSKSSNVGEIPTPTVKGFDVSNTKISHSLWLLLQGHSAKGVLVGKNIQDNTVIYACKVIAHKDAERFPTRTISSELSSETPVARTLLWDFIHQDDGPFVGFQTMPSKIHQILGKDVLIKDKWSDVDALIQGLNLEWPQSILEALNVVYNCIDQADTLGICAATDFKQVCATRIPNITANIILDCLQILVQEQLILEVGFEILRFVSTRNASKWLIHSTRLPPQEDRYETASKKQRLDPLVDDTKDDKEDEASKDDEEEQEDDVIVLSDDEFELLDSSPTNKEREQQMPKDGNQNQIVEISGVDSSQPSKESEQIQDLTEDNEENQVTEKPHVAEENVEADESIDELRKRKRPISPTMCNGTPVTFVGRSWLSIEGYQPISQLSKYMQYVLMQVTSKPGIKELTLCEYFKDVLHPVECLELLKMLREVGCVTRHKAHKLRPTTAFKTEVQYDPNSTFYYYQPTADCLVKIAEFNQHVPSSETTPSESSPASPASESNLQEFSPATTPSKLNQQESSPAVTPSESSPAVTPSQFSPAAMPSESSPTASPSEYSPAAMPSESSPAAMPSELNQQESGLRLSKEDKTS